MCVRARAYVYVCACVCVCGEKLRNKVIQSEEFYAKESWRDNVSVLINHQQDIEKRWKRNTVYVLMQNYTRVFLNIAVLHDLATVG